jgi:hypothetical protein
MAWVRREPDWVWHLEPVSVAYAATTAEPGAWPMGTAAEPGARWMVLDAAGSDQPEPPAHGTGWCAPSP